MINVRIKNEKLVRKYDLRGEKYLGKIRAWDLGYENKRSLDILKRFSVPIIKERYGVVGWTGTVFCVYTAGVDNLMVFEHKYLRTTGVDFWSNKQVFIPSLDGVYRVEAVDATNLPIEARVTKTVLKVKVGNVFYTLDADATSVLIYPTGSGYEHSVYLNGGLNLYLKRGEEIRFYFYYEAEVGGVPLATNHARFCSFELLE